MRRKRTALPGTLRAADRAALTTAVTVCSAISLWIATQSLLFAGLALLGGSLIVSVAAASGSARAAFVEPGRIVSERGVLVLREHVVRLVATRHELRVDTVHGGSCALALDGRAVARSLIDEIHTAWPELRRWDERTLYREATARGREPVAWSELVVRAPFAILAPPGSDGYRDAAPSGVTLRYEGTTPWSLERGADALAALIGGAPARVLRGPLVHVRVNEREIRLLTAGDDVVLPCAEGRHAREGAVVLRRLLRAR
ncbi:MAG: hypothetical protein K1X94_24590 [Sandaracinaceae bacterium]|nr:hypothetical protein [Sandaracinaceae bacterium]